MMHTKMQSQLQRNKENTYKSKKVQISWIWHMSWFSSLYMWGHVQMVNKEKCEGYDKTEVLNIFDYKPPALSKTIFKGLLIAVVTKINKTKKSVKCLHLIFLPFK